MKLRNKNSKNYNKKMGQLENKNLEEETDNTKKGKFSPDSKRNVDGIEDDNLMNFEDDEEPEN